MTLRVATVNYTPFMTYHPENKTWSGFCYEILEKLGQDLRLDFEIFAVADGGWGTNTNGTWDGMIGAVVRGEADIAAQIISLTPEREAVVEFTPPFYTSGMTAVMKKLQQKHSPFEFTKPFNDDLWIIISASIVLYAILLFVTSKIGQEIQKATRRKEETYSLSFLESLSIIGHAFIQQEGDFRPRILGERIIMVTWRVYSLILIATYTANFTAFLSSSFKEKSIDSFQDLLDDKNMTYGLERSTSNYDFFKYTKYYKYREAFAKMQKWGTFFPPSSNIQDSMSRISTTTALITDDMSIKLIRQFTHCSNGIYATKPINFEEQAFVMRRGLPQAKNISEKMRSYGRSGYLTKMIHIKWPSCPTSATNHAVDFDRLIGFFGIMLLGAVIAIASPWVLSWDLTRVKLMRRFQVYWGTKRIKSTKY